MKVLETPPPTAGLRERRRSGMTLAELMVFMFLMSLLMTATYYVYVLSMRYMRIAQGSLDLQQQAQRAMAAIVNDLSDSDAGAVFSSSNSSTGTLTSGSTSVTTVSSTVVNWINSCGMTVTVTGGASQWSAASNTLALPSGTTVSSANGTSLTLSQAATWSGSETIGFSAGTNGVIALSCRDTSGNIQSGPTWQAWVGYYVDASHNLVRKRINFAAGAPTGVPTAPTTTLQANPFTSANGYPSSTDIVSNFKGASGGTTQVVAVYDTSLSCSGTTPVIISATFSTSVQSPDDCQINIQDAVWPRN